MPNSWHLIWRVSRLIGLRRINPINLGEAGRDCLVPAD